MSIGLGVYEASRPFKKASRLSDILPIMRFLAKYPTLFTQYLQNQFLDQFEIKCVGKSSVSSFKIVYGCGGFENFTALENALQGLLK